MKAGSGRLCMQVPNGQMNRHKSGKSKKNQMVKKEDIDMEKGCRRMAAEISTGKKCPDQESFSYSYRYFSFEMEVLNVNQ
ncbi:hypothetical protein [Emcibacter sp.]|uniref:hypothetical protein n=1 Tax=Emcibacter sp. TaxID=1979954 RepID=UPI003A93D616